MNESDVKRLVNLELSRMLVNLAGRHPTPKDIDVYLYQAARNLQESADELERDATASAPKLNPCNKCWKPPVIHRKDGVDCASPGCRGIGMWTYAQWQANNPLSEKPPEERRFPRNTKLRAKNRDQTIRIVQTTRGEFCAMDEASGKLFYGCVGPGLEDVSLSELGFDPDNWTPIE